MASIVLGGGCFWCVEAVFLQIEGVESVVSGYAGGENPNPTYREVCSGSSGHAEVVKIDYDSEVIDLETLLKIFFTTHDPTTLNRQGGDVGTQYRSVIYYANEDEKSLIEKIIKEYAESIWDDPIVTEMSPLPEFYKAEEYHQDYYNNNPSQSYCAYVITPKVAKARAKFSQYLKS